MKNIYLFIAGLLLAGCSKEKTFGPWNLQDGQEVEVQVSHRFGATDDNLTLIPQNKTTDGSIYSFNEREPGYNYRVKARMIAPDVPPQDGPLYWLEFVKVISKEKYNGSDPFTIELIHGGMSGPYIMLRKENGKFYFIPEKIMLTAASAQINDDLEEISEYNSQYIANHLVPIKWKSVKATVKHDPTNFGHAYLISSIQFIE